MIKAIIFDLDGTVLDTLPTIHHYLNSTFKKFSLPEIGYEKCRAIVGRGARNLLVQCFEHFGINDSELFERVFAEYNRDYDANPDYLTKPYDGILELLCALREKGYKLAVLSNKPDFATRSLVARFFPNLFDVVHGGRAGIPLKPSGEAALSLLGELDVTREECAYVGDSEIDVFTAKAFCPALPVAVSWGFRTPEELIAAGASLIISSPDELTPLVNSAP